MIGVVDEGRYPTAFGFRSLIRGWKLIAGCAVAFLAAGLVVLALKPARYTASTQFLIYVREVQPGPDLVVSAGRADLTQVENEIEIIRSPGTLARVVRLLNLDEDPEFQSGAGSPWGGVEALLGTAPAAPEDGRRDRRERAVDNLARHVVIARIGTSHTLRVDVTTSDPRKSVRIADTLSEAVQQARVSADQDGDRSPLLRERLQGLGPSVYVITPAQLADRPDGPRKAFVLLGLAAAGLATGSLLALLRDLLDGTVRTAEQVEYFGLDCIGALPTPVTGPAAPRDARGSDPLRDRTLLRATAAIEASHLRIVGIAGAVAGEGAARVARELARMAASCGREVLLLEAQGAEAPAGRARPGHDLVVVGLPPLESGSEYRQAARAVDGVLLVVSWGRVHRARIERAFAVAGAVPADFVGAVLDGVDPRMIGRFGDRLWAAQAAAAPRHAALGLAMTGAPVAGHS